MSRALEVTIYHRADPIIKSIKKKKENLQAFGEHDHFATAGAMEKKIADTCTYIAMRFGSQGPRVVAQDPGKNRNRTASSEIARS